MLRTLTHDNDLSDGLRSDLTALGGDIFCLLAHCPEFTHEHARSLFEQEAGRVARVVLHSLLRFKPPEYISTKVFTRLRTTRRTLVHEDYGEFYEFGKIIFNLVVRNRRMTAHKAQKLLEAGPEILLQPVLDSLLVCGHQPLIPCTLDEAWNGMTLNVYESLPGYATDFRYVDHSLRSKVFSAFAGTLVHPPHTRSTFNVVVCPVHELVEDSPPTQSAIFRSARRHGLRLCPPLTGFALAPAGVGRHLKEGTEYIVASRPIKTEEALHLISMRRTGESVTIGFTVHTRHRNFPRDTMLVFQH